MSSLKLLNDYLIKTSALELSGDRTESFKYIKIFFSLTFIDIKVKYKIKSVLEYILLRFFSPT